MHLYRSVFYAVMFAHTSDGFQRLLVINLTLNQSIYSATEKKLEIIKCNSIFTVNQDSKVWCTLTGAQIVHRELKRYSTVYKIK